MPVTVDFFDSSLRLHTNMESEGDKVVKPLMNVLKFGGLWFDFSNIKYGNAFKWFNILRTALASLIWAIQIAYFFKGGLSYLLTESGVFVPICFDETCMAIIVMCNQKAIRGIITTYKKRFDSFSTSPWTKSIIDAEMNKFNRIFQLPKVTLFVFFCFYSIAPLAYDLIISKFTNKKTPYIVPLPLNFLIDLPLRRTTDFYAVIYLSYIYLFIIVIRFIAFEAIVLYLVAFIVIDVKILIRKMEMLSDKDDGSVFLQEEWQLKDVINHHSTIVCLVRDYFWFLGFALMLQNLTLAVSSCLVIYLTKTSYNNGDIVLALFCANFLLLLMILNLMFNGAGVIIENQGVLLLTSIYNTKWYKQPPKVRKEINSMLRQGLKLFKISYKLNPVNLEAAMLVMNRAYSFFTLINTGEKDG